MPFLRANGPRLRAESVRCVTGCPVGFRCIPGRYGLITIARSGESYFCQAREAGNLSDRTTTEIVEREFLELRARLLDLAASLDRIRRAEGPPDERMRVFESGLSILLDDTEDKARRIQELYSRQYSDRWREQMNL